MTREAIQLRGVRQHNLQGFDLDVPKRTLTVVVGVSGSGKSSLVFDTIAAEAQRHLNATFSSYAQHHLPSYGRPDADRLSNLAAPVIIDQRRLVGGPRSTVVTVTDIGDSLRLLFAKAATPALGNPAAFSFNHPEGMCPDCHGLGVAKVVDVEAFVDESRSLREGPFNHLDYRPGTAGWSALAESGMFDLDVPLDQYSKRELALLLDADPSKDPDGGLGQEGVLVRFRRVQLAKDPAALRGAAKRAYEALVTTAPCAGCEGTRLNSAARGARVAGLTLPEVHALQVSDLIERMRTWSLGPWDLLVGAAVEQLQHLNDLGLGYLNVGRDTRTLSGGEAQRVKLVRHLGSTLTDLLYVFDEPTVGLHARDVDQVGRMLRRIRDQGNTVLVVEHDPAIMAIADHLVEIGPGAGRTGGRLLFQGTFEELMAADTPTAAALRAAVAPPRVPRRPAGALRIARATSHNLRNVTVDVPLGVLTAVTGVAGSGKSSLVHGHLAAVAPDAVFIDQSPIRGSRRSTPASWTGMLDEIRAFFAASTGRPASLFSPNSDGGCRSCEGLGVRSVDLGIGDSVLTACEVCEGRRFRPAALRHLVGGVSIADVFEMTIDEASDRLTTPRLNGLLARSAQVGLGYLTLGQALTTLSGGERQRLKLARELAGDARILVLDEPTTGLHLKDIERLLRLLHALVDEGRTVVVIEHDLGTIAGADHIIDLGPEAGHAGGHVQFAGTVADLLATSTHTGRFLARYLTGAQASYRAQQRT